MHKVLMISGISATITRCQSPDSLWVRDFGITGVIHNGKTVEWLSGELEVIEKDGTVLIGYWAGLLRSCTTVVVGTSQHRSEGASSTNLMNFERRCPVICDLSDHAFLGSIAMEAISMVKLHLTDPR